MCVCEFVSMCVCVCVCVCGSLCLCVMWVWLYLCSLSLGTMMGLCASVQSLMRTVGPTIGGFLYENYGVPSFGYIQCAINAAVFILLFKDRRSEKHKKLWQCLLWHSLSRGWKLKHSIPVDCDDTWDMWYEIYKDDMLYFFLLIAKITSRNDDINNNLHCNYMNAIWIVKLYVFAQTWLYSKPTIYSSYIKHLPVVCYKHCMDLMKFFVRVSSVWQVCPISPMVGYDCCVMCAEWPVWVLSAVSIKGHTWQSKALQCWHRHLSRTTLYSLSESEDVGRN